MLKPLINRLFFIYRFCEDILDIMWWSIRGPNRAFFNELQLVESKLELTSKLQLVEHELEIV